MSRITTWFIFIYGIVILAVGCYGLKEQGAMPLLWADVSCGGLLVLSAVGMFFGQSLGVYVSLIVTFLLTGVFSYRYAITDKEVPAILAVLSAGMLLFLLVRFGKWKSR